MTPFDSQIKRAKDEGNNNKKSILKVAKANHVKKPKKTVHPKTGDDDNNRYRSVRATAQVVDIYQALQMVLGDKNRSDTMQKVFDAGKDKILNTSKKRADFENKLKGIKLIRSAK